jgi:hypothetical protein
VVYCLQTFVAGASVGTLWSHSTGIAALTPQSLRLQAQLMLASLGSCHKSGECAKSCARRSVCFCSQNGGGASIGLLT